jgi:hypothetical protein
VKGFFDSTHESRQHPSRTELDDAFHALRGQERYRALPLNRVDQLTDQLFAQRCRVCQWLSRRIGYDRRAGVCERRFRDGALHALGSRLHERRVERSADLELDAASRSTF